VIEGSPFLVDGPPAAERTVVLAHGAGAPMDSPFLATVAAGLGARGLRVVRFEFPYMARRRQGGGRKTPPDPAPVLERCFREVIDAVGAPARMVIGGKSLGGRIASQVADAAGVLGLLCLGFPFHPPGQPARLRTDHLRGLRTPTLIVQGERDPFGGLEDVPGYELSRAISVAWVPDGEHSLRPRLRSGRTEDDNLRLATELVAAFALAL
jgi:predicted alpha/beta-hydrolase family hydrolase